MWIFLSRELWRWNQTVTPALRAAILSASLDTQKKKKAYFLFHIIKVSLRYLSPSLWNQPTATATLSRHCTAAAYKRPEAPSRGHVVKPQGWGESLGPGPQLQPPPPTAWQIAICTAEILILLSKHIQGFPASVVWLTAPVSEGLALCTPNVRPQPDDCLSVHGLLRSGEWCGGMEVVGSELRREAGANCCLRNQSLIWPVGFGCLWEELLLPRLLLQLLVSGVDRHPSSQHCESGAWWHCMFDPCPVTWRDSRSLAERTQGRTQALAHHLKPPLYRDESKYF